MKKIFLSITLIVVVGAGIYLFMQKSAGEHAYQTFISSDAQFVLTQYDLEKRVDEFARSPLGGALDSLDYGKIGRELDMSDEEIDRILEARQNISAFFDNPLFNTLFGAQVSCALFPFSYRDDSPLEEQILENLLIIARPKRGAKLIDVATWFDFTTQSVSTSRYGRHTITRYDLDGGRRVSGIRVDDLLVLSFSEPVLRRSLDVFDGEQPGLMDVASYRDTIDRFDGASLKVYTDFQEMSAMVDHVVSGSLANYTTASSRSIGENPYQMGLFGAWRHDDRIVDQAIITFAPEHLDDPVNSRLRTRTETPRSYANTGLETILYHWTNQFDTAHILQLVGESEATGDASDSNPFAELLGIAGLSVDQAGELFTGDLTLAVQGLKHGQLVPLPLFILSLESDNIELLESSVDKIIDHYSIPVQRKKINEDVELISWGGLIGIGSVLPAFAFTDNHLVISSNRQEIRAFIEDNRVQNLASKEQFQKVSDELLKPSNSVTYIEFAEFTTMLKEMASWGGTMIAIKDRELARKSTVLIDEMINPVLDGLAMYGAIASRKYIDEHMIIFESQTILAHGK